jgi:hypothetical protein
MLPRRALVIASVGAGLAALAAVPAPLEAQTTSGDFPPAALRALEDIRRAVEQMAARTTACQEFTCPAVDQIRQTQKQYFKANGKFPDFIDVGYDLFMAAHDWHVRARQEPHQARTPDGRLSMRFFMTMLILRNDVSDGFLSVGYDAR